MSDRSVKVRLWASTSEYETAMKRARGATTDLGGEIDKTAAGGSQKVGALGSSFVTMGKAAVAAGAVAALKSTIDAASNLEESINAVTVTYGDNAEAVLAIGENSAKSFGLSKSEFNGFAVQFSAFANQVAEKDGRAVADVLGEMTTRVADFASVMNLDLNTAAQIFQSTMAGETEPIRKFGIDVSAAAVETYALANGLIETKSQLTEAIKVQARYGLLMQSTATTSGDFAATSGSLANSQRILSAELEDASAKLGQTFAPALAVVVSGLVDVLGVLEQIKVLDAISLSWVEPVGTSIGNFFADLASGGGAADLRAAHAATVAMLTDAEKAAGEFDRTLLANVTTFSEARRVAMVYAESIDGLVDTDTAANLIALEWNKTTNASAAEMDAAAEAAILYAEGLRANASEATYNADANEEMGRIQRATTEAVEAATAAQDAFMESIRFTRDEVGALKREIDDRQAFLDLQDTFADVTAMGIDVTEMTREQEQAMNDLKLEVLDYAESINLPESVTTRLVAMVDAGRLGEVESILARWGDGITVPIRLDVVNMVNTALQARGVTARVTSEGNLRRAAGGPTSAGSTYEVLEGGRSELLTEGGRTFLMAANNGYVTPLSGSSGGGSSGDRTGVHIEHYHDESGVALSDVYRAANTHLALMAG